MIKFMNHYETFWLNLDPKHQDFCGMAKKDQSEICLIDVNQVPLHKGIVNFVFVVSNIK